MKPLGPSCALRNLATVIALGFSAISAAQDGYRYTQDESSPNSPTSSGPVRMARISYTEGSVTWRPSEDVDWSVASANIPLRQGAQLWVSTGGRAEVQFDDGSRLRLGSGGIATIQTLFSDRKGEFTEVKFNSGLASLTLTNKDSMYQIDTPLTAIKAFGPARIRVGVGDDVEVAIRRGEAQLEGNQGTATLGAGDYVDISDSTNGFEVRRAPNGDGWDRFSDSRDDSYDHPSQFVPSNIGIVAGDLNDYGTWRPDPHYGHVWYPHVRYAGWRPYHDGHWVWLEPFGWTWVADEPWGWAPYHYGTWIHASYGWGWCPGPRRQYWSPAVVNFSVYNGAVAWCPLAPSEVYYPTALSIGFGSGNWFFSFSIGGTACYYPGRGNYCVARPWNNAYVNRSVNVYNVNRVTNIYNINSRYISNHRFVPEYGRAAFAITRTTTAGFVGRGKFQTGTSSDISIFQRGHGFAAPRGQVPVFGPANVRPSREAVIPTRSFVSTRPSVDVMQRPVFRSRLPSAVAKGSAPFRTSTVSTSRPSQVERGMHTGSSKYNNRNAVGSFGRTEGRASGNSAPAHTRTDSTSPYSRYNSISSGRRGSSAGRTENSRTSIGETPSNRARSGGSFETTGRVRGNSPFGRPPQTGSAGRVVNPPPRPRGFTPSESAPPRSEGTRNREFAPRRTVEPPRNTGIRRDFPPPRRDTPPPPPRNRDTKRRGGGF